MNRHAIFILTAAALVILIHSGCAKLPEGFDRPESHALSDTQNTLFGKLLADEKADHPGKSGFHLLAPVGHQFYESLADRIPIIIAWQTVLGLNIQ